MEFEDTAWIASSSIFDISVLVILHATRRNSQQKVQVPKTQLKSLQLIIGDGTQRKGRGTGHRRASWRWPYCRHSATVTICAGRDRCTCIEGGNRALFPAIRPPLIRTDLNQGPLDLSGQSRAPQSHNIAPCRGPALCPRWAEWYWEVNTTQSDQPWSNSRYTMEYKSTFVGPNSRSKC